MSDTNGKADSPARKTEGAGAVRQGGGEPAFAPERLERVLEVEVEVTVELGRRRLRIADVLGMSSGTVIEFAKSSDEPLDVLVNNQLVARGEAVVIGERYGVRIVEVVSPNERLRTSGVVKEGVA